MGTAVRSQLHKELRKAESGTSGKSTPVGYPIPNDHPKKNIYTYLAFYTAPRALNSSLRLYGKHFTKSLPSPDHYFSKCVPEVQGSKTIPSPLLLKSHGAGGHLGQTFRNTLLR